MNEILKRLRSGIQAGLRVALPAAMLLTLVAPDALAQQVSPGQRPVQSQIEPIPPRPPVPPDPPRPPQPPDEPFPPGPPTDSPPPERTGITTVKSVAAEDQQDLMVTVYNNDYGLVREVRELDLPTGLIELEYEDVAERIDPTSVAFKSLAAPDQVAILEQNYRYDLLNPESLLTRFVGRPIAYSMWRLENDTQVLEVRDGILLSNNGGQIVRFGDEIVINPPGQVTLPEVPEDLLAQPTLIWLLRNQYSGPQRVETAYLTDGMNWKADYVVVLHPDPEQMNLTGWVTLTNHSGNTYHNALLKLVAGEVQRVKERPEMAMMARAAMADVAVEEGFAERAFFEYHLYTLGRRTTLFNNETKQISLLEASDVPYDKLYIMESGPWVVQTSMQGEEMRHLNVFVEFENEEESGMGIALPAGRVRFYQEDPEDNSLQLIGEDTIEHTPRDETVRLMLGEAFDVVGTRTQTSFRKLAERVSEMSYRVEVRNHKDEPITATILEHVYGDWEMVSQSHEFERKDATTIAFELDVPARGEEVLTYTVRVRW